MIRWGALALGVALIGTAGAAQAQSPQIERGGYLVNTIMTCQNCHTPMGPNGPDFSKALSGGLEFDEPPFKVTASNITQDKETGIGAWTDAQIKTLLRTGKRPNGVQIAEVMPTSFYGIITESDMDAIVAYLRTVKPVKNKVPDPVYKIALPHHAFPGSEKPYTEAMLADNSQMLAFEPMDFGPLFGAPRFDSFTQGRGWWRALAELALSTAAFFAVAGLILAIRGHLGLH